jgi:hypothetical protein
MKWTLIIVAVVIAFGGAVYWISHSPDAQNVQSSPADAPSGAPKSAPEPYPVSPQPPPPDATTSKKSP